MSDMDVAVPEAFLCPISRELMLNPHMNMVGQTYDLKAISEWLAMGKRVDPVTRQPLKDTRLVPNIALRSQILEWKQKHLDVKLKECAAVVENKSKARSEGDGKQSTAEEKDRTIKPTSADSWKQKAMKEWTPAEVKSFVSQIGSSENWKSYADDLHKEKVDGVVLLVMVDTEAAVSFGFGKIYAMALSAAIKEFKPEFARLKEMNEIKLRGVAKNAKNLPPQILKHGIRILVRTQSSGRICHLEGRLVNFSQRSDGDWELQVDAPLLAPKRRTFIYRDNSSEYMIPPLEKLQMGVGARVVGPFPDLTADGGWAWYEGDVKTWDGRKATVQYTDGCTWVARYPESTHMLEIDRSEELLSLPALAALGKNVEKMPLIVIREGKARPPDPLKLGVRVLVRSKGESSKSCLLEGRLVDWKETKEGKWEFAVDAPLLKPKRLNFVFEAEQSPNEEAKYIIPPQDEDLAMGVGARVVGPIKDSDVDGGWAWQEGDVKTWDGQTATVLFADGQERKAKYPGNQTLLDIRGSEQLLSEEAVTSLNTLDLPLIVVRENRTAAPSCLRKGTRVLVRASGMNNGPCLLEGRLIDYKERFDGRWQLYVDAPLVDPKRRTFLFTEGGSEYVIPPETEKKMEVGARVVGCFGDREADGGWAWYEGDVTKWDGKVARVEYTDGTEWMTEYPVRREMLKIEDSERMLTTNSVRQLHPTRMPLIVLKEAKNGAPEELRTGKRVLVRTLGANGAPCLLEGRLVDFEQKDGKWSMTVNSPLGTTKRRTLIYSENPVDYIIISPEKELKMGIDARVVGCFGDSQAEGGWAWYEGVVMGWDGARATVMYTDGTTWTSKFPPPANLLSIRNSEGVLNRASVSQMNPEDMPLIVVSPGLS
eukprot:CAMPEP_0114506532 /NCGR_PEP_ID=MMETSP0109-20121206/11476_1 /TAXON_ID=29199 /ORGANISM="Chlorarachnion reptans, Strain CCCM449" /LENGTH=877 /DNA_ID=CAMNT_0001685123 /DNA_START=154 /DNA_END=2787 /DNA_ORIENTATION=+